MAQDREPELTLGQALADTPALSTAPLSPEMLEIPLHRFSLTFPAPAAETPLYWPPGMTVAGAQGGAPAPVPDAVVEPPRVTAQVDSRHPKRIDEAEAVKIAHKPDIEKAAQYLDAGLSVVVQCEKLLVEYLAKEITTRSGRKPTIVRPETTAGPGEFGGMQAGRRQQSLHALQEAVRHAKENDVVVVPHLDLLAGGSDAALNSEARELTDVLYDRSSCVLLAFVDPSLVIPEVLANRFAVRISIDILPREVRRDDGRAPVGTALVTESEAAMFSGFDEVGLYKHIAGMNAVRFRHAMRYAQHQHRDGGTFTDLLDELRIFKATTSNDFDLPDVTFDQIGGYQPVKDELQHAIDLINGGAGLPEHLHRELIPRGFIFHGPPGTGKTLFAKALATAFQATINVVSGPEVTDMYVGESERKVREIFAEARRNAPAVVVFDEFDSIASRRSGREDGGSRAGNAIVAQLLTEMDGFRPAVPVLIVGTTNRLDIIDEALLRPSRFRPIRIDLPDLEARRRIAEVHAAHFGIPVTEALLNRIATATNLMNGDDIRSIFTTARGEAAVKRMDPVKDPYRLGQLVGRLRRTIQERDADRSQRSVRRPSNAGGGRATGDPAMIPQTPEEPAQP
ncbi:ATP-binding protein [Actinoplanes sp. NEAU-A11]|uniref:ATP-binding protein n=2 Tax=Actinoplanes aureus TaxID=2792083 RepID=A0A931FXJ5_9ACTN|nr:ATP-binding protein [Actinoplanes aureus]